MAKMTPSASAISSPSAISDELARMIVDGELEAGARITEREVSELFRCSAATAREAFHLLQKQGAIMLSARRGARIVDGRDAPPGDVFVVWDCLRGLLGEEVRGQSEAGSEDLPALGAGAPSRRLAAVEARLARLGRIARNEKLAQVLSRVAMHVAIVAPERLAEVEASLAR